MNRRRCAERDGRNEGGEGGQEGLGRQTKVGVQVGASANMNGAHGLAGRLRALLNDPDANTARIEDFPRIDRPRICRRCNFRKLCFPRADALEVKTPRRPSSKTP